MQKFFFKFIIISLVSISFFLGYLLRENSVGGGPEFYALSWPIIQSFKEDFLFTINNYAIFGDGTIPFSHIINAYLNPFSDIDTSFQYHWRMDLYMYLKYEKKESCNR